MIRNAILPTAAAALLSGLAACGGSGTSTVHIVASDESALRQALAAIPAEEFATICLHVVDVRLRIEADDPDESGWHSVPVPPDETGEEDCPLDLAALLRGEVVELAWGEVPSGKLTELRFVLAADQGYAILADDPAQERIPVFVPSGSQSGLKLKGEPIVLEPDEEEQVGLIFDAEASIREHNGDQIRIRPVIRIAGSETDPGDGAGGTGGDGGSGGSGGSTEPTPQ